jgi:hypothetical protein
MCPVTCADKAEAQGVIELAVSLAAKGPAQNCPHLIYPVGNCHPLPCITACCCRVRAGTLTVQEETD